MQIQREREKIMTPKLSGLASALGKFRHDTEVDADKLMLRLNGVDQRRKAAIAKTHGTLDAAEGGIKEVEDFVDALEGHNGGDPLDVSSTPSGVRSSEVAQK